MTMTMKELAVAILNLPTASLDEPAGVWPPGACPENSFVPITGVELMTTKALKPVLVTGKKPT